MNNFKNVTLNFAKEESQRFGIRVFRGMAEEIDEKEILHDVIESEVDLAILRIPSKYHHKINRLNRTGLPYIVADNLVYYYVELNNYNPRELRNKNLEFIKCELGHVVILNQLVDECFKDYSNHYYSNPYLDKNGVLEGYKEWARCYISSEESGRLSWLVQVDGRFIGFATCSFNKEQDEAEGVLYAVTPEAAGSGVYGDIIRFTQSFFKAQGFKWMKVSTQIQNYAVQKVWSREGFFLKKAYDTVHINSFMHHSVIREESFSLEVTPQDIQDFGRVSGDFNPVHFDSEFAMSKGLEGRIAHGLLINSIASKYYGMSYPGIGTLFMGYSYKFLKPLYIGQKYMIRISFPMIDSKKGIYLSMIQVRDSNQNIQMFSYSDLYKK